MTRGFKKPSISRN